MDEAGARDGEAHPAATAIAECHGHLSGTRAGQQVAGADQIEELGLAHPTPPLHGFALHQDDVRGRTPERGQAEACEEPEDLTQG